MAHTFSSIEYPAFQSSERGPEIIGVSLSDPHTSMTGLRMWVYILPCLLVVTYKRFRFEWIYVKIHTHFKFSDVLLIVHDNEFLLSSSMLMDLLSARDCVWRVLDLLSFITPHHFQAFPSSSFDCLQYAKIEGKAWEHFIV